MEAETDAEAVELVEGGVVRQFSRAALLAALMGATAIIAIPIAGIPGTLQPLIVFLAGIYLGPYWGAVSMLLYLAAGAAGAPVFAGWNAGFGHLVGPTGGFLLAFPVVAFLIGYAVHRGSDLRDPAAVSLLYLGGVLLAVTALLYASGVSWYAWVVGIEVTEAAVAVAAPLVPGDLVKIAVALTIARSGRIDTV